MKTNNIENYGQKPQKHNITKEELFQTKCEQRQRTMQKTNGKIRKRTEKNNKRKQNRETKVLQLIWGL